MLEPKPDCTRVVVGRAEEIAPGTTKKFLFVQRGQEIEGFVLHRNGEFHAYLNRCRHVPMTMDWVENQFFTEDGEYIMCATHGACYVPETGECVEGPPFGKFLIRVPLEFHDGEIVAVMPEDA
jgi:nitrite reductase/ring-hydroxylating ferredoxin subunit